MSLKEKIMSTTKNFIEKYIYSKKTVQEKNNETKSKIDKKTKIYKKTKIDKKEIIINNDEQLEIEVRKEFIRLNEEKKKRKMASP